MKLKEYISCVEEIATGFFDENGEYVPHLGKANLVRIYAKYFFSEEKNIEELNTRFENGEIVSTDYIDKLIELIGTYFIKDMNDIEIIKNNYYVNEVNRNNFFSFGRAVKDAEAIVEFTKEKKTHTTKLDEFLQGLIDLEKNLKPEEIEKIMGMISNHEKLDESALVKEYWKNKTGEEA